MLSIFYDVIHIFLSKASSNTQIDSRAGGIGGARVPIFTPNILQIHYPYSNMGGGGRFSPSITVCTSNFSDVPPYYIQFIE